ncbi:DUF4982 domain-containing protein [Fulvivirga sp. M361]|uniref:glycoside hydrolase family 2 TIM barrel-domain containing protein n=1 Tax=Fulvivirga sp. M361 TaxID=2594266 RepID=UPI00117A8C95|nr:glycoside hydrolase family 2 TIM barrel-domain containing protein [Fulvivirga sp. M361]TRX51182.1 DUF4982 domain-containing protein [Fulvivirga sp. M361]
MKKINFLFLGVVVCNLCFSQPRLTQSINAHWSFFKGDINQAAQQNFDDSDWKVVGLPHTWNDKDVLPDENRGYYRGVGWYRKHLNISKTNLEKRRYLHFEGAGQEVMLYINGSPVGTHVGGYSAFTFDVTDFLVKGDNVLAARVDNTPNPNIAPLSADFTFFGGIYRDVFLIETDQVHFNMLDHGSKGIFVTSSEVNENEAVLQIKGSVDNDTDESRKVSVRAIVYDETYKAVSEIEEKIKLTAYSSSSFDLQKKLKDIMLWSPAQPYLYTIEVQLREGDVTKDEVMSRTGFRWFRFDPSKGFFLNGQPLKLMGANRHQDYWGMGNALSNDQHRSDLELLKAMGGIFIRLAHYPQDPAVLDAADELGLLVWEEIPLVNEITLSEEHDQNAEVMLKEMIRQHYNHPSVILWGYMNEIYWAHRFLDEAVVTKHTDATVTLARRLEKVARAEDPSRYTAMALHNYPLYEASGIAEIPMVVGWNLYHGWYYDTYGDFGKFMDEQHKKHPGRVHIISEYGAGSDPRLHSTAPERFDFTVEGQKRFLESFLEQIQERPFIAGASVWNLIDFSSERRIDSNPHLNNKGLATTDRTPKDPYFLFQAALSQKPIIKIAETNWVERSGYPNAGDTTVTQPVQVYSNLPDVELWMNGTSLGTKQIHHSSATWSVPFTHGSHEFRATTPSNTSGLNDQLTIHFQYIPTELSLQKNRIDIAINAGCNYSFYDEKGKVNWLPDKAYAKGSWGYIGGEPLYVSKKIGTKEDILTTTDLDPLYQSIRIGSEAYQFDVADGWYEVELFFVENYPRSRRFVEGKESPTHPGGLRQMKVSINDQVLYGNLDLLKTYGYNYPLMKRVKIKAHHSKGIKVSLEALKGETTISAIRIRQL